MKNYIFKYLTSATNNLVKYLIVKSNIISIFPQKPNLSEPNIEFSMIRKFEQCNPACLGKPYDYISEIDLEHEVIDPHAHIGESKLNHFHLKLCAPITPEDFKCFLDQLEKFQKDPVMRQNMPSDSGVRLAIALLKLARQKNVAVDTSSDYLSNHDYKAAADQYAKHYDSFKEQISELYQQHQKDLTWSDEFAEISAELKQTVFYSGALASLYSFLRQTLIANNVPENQAEWFVHALGLTTIAITGTTYYPFLFAVLVTATLKLIKAPDKVAQMSSIVIANLISIASNYSFTPYSLLKLTLNSCASVPTAYISSKVVGGVTRQFWQYFKPATVIQPMVQNAQSLKLKNA